MKNVIALSLVAACGFAAALPVATPAFAGEARWVAYRSEKIDNPMYVNWAKFKPGTTVKTKVVSDMAGNKSDITTTTKLLEVTAEKVVIEMSSSMKMGDQTFDMPAQKMDFPAKVEKQPEEKTKEEVKPKTGEEEIEVAGKKYKAKWTESVMEANGIKTTSKVWTSEEFPGMTLKMESKMEGGMSGTTKSEVVEVTMG